MIAAGTLQVCYDARILSEYRAVLQRPRFKIDQQDAEAFLEQLEHQGDVVAAAPLEGKVGDEGDRPFAEVAIAAKAVFLVTGNIRHFPERRYGGATVLAPADFIRRLRRF